jgi:hypothetical protein
MAEIQRSSIGLSGECFVVLELLRLKFSIGIILCNGKAKDHTMDYPHCFLYTASDAKGQVKQYSTSGILDLTTLNNADFKERRDKIEKKKPNYLS